MIQEVICDAEPLKVQDEMTLFALEQFELCDQRTIISHIFGQNSDVVNSSEVNFELAFLHKMLLAKTTVVTCSRGPPSIESELEELDLAQLLFLFHDFDLVHVVVLCVDGDDILDVGRLLLRKSLGRRDHYIIFFVVGSMVFVLVITKLQVVFVLEMTAKKR